MFALSFLFFPWKYTEWCWWPVILEAEGCSKYTNWVICIYLPIPHTLRSAFSLTCIDAFVLVNLIQLFDQLQSFLEVCALLRSTLHLLFLFFVSNKFPVTFGMFVLEGRILRYATFGTQSVIPLSLLDFIIKRVLSIHAGEHKKDNFIIVTLLILLIVKNPITNHWLVINTINSNGSITYQLGNSTRGAASQQKSYQCPSHQKGQPEPLKSGIRKQQTRKSYLHRHVLSWHHSHEVDLW